MKRFRPGLWPVTLYAALTVVLTSAFLVITRGDVAAIRQYWGFLAIPLGMPWTAVALLIDQFALSATGLVIGIIALSVPANVVLLFLIGRRLDRRPASPAA